VRVFPNRDQYTKPKPTQPIPIRLRMKRARPLQNP
jgi:hypothetical protein